METPSGPRLAASWTKEGEGRERTRFYEHLRFNERKGIEGWRVVGIRASQSAVPFPR